MARVNIDHTALQGMMNDQKVAQAVRMAGERIVSYAKDIFISQRVMANSGKSEHYLDGFIINMDGSTAYVGNVDDTSFWVEFGVRHVGSGEHILGYAPLRRGVDAAAADL